MFVVPRRSCYPKSGKIVGRLSTVDERTIGGRGNTECSKVRVETRNRARYPRDGTSSCVEVSRDILGTDIKGIRASVKRAVAQRGFHYQRAVIARAIVSRMEKDTRRNENIFILHIVSFFFLFLIAIFGKRIVEKEVESSSLFFL